MGASGSSFLHVDVTFKRGGSSDEMIPTAGVLLQPGSRSQRDGSNTTTRQHNNTTQHNTRDHLLNDDYSTLLSQT
jgi:hypothetical protein